MCSALCSFTAGWPSICRACRKWKRPPGVAPASLSAAKTGKEGPSTSWTVSRLCYLPCSFPLPFLSSSALLSVVLSVSLQLSPLANSCAVSLVPRFAALDHPLRQQCAVLPCYGKVQNIYTVRLHSLACLCMCSCSACLLAGMFLTVSFCSLILSTISDHSNISLEKPSDATATARPPLKRLAGRAATDP